MFTLDVDQQSDAFRCLTTNAEERVRAQALIRKIAPEAVFRVDAGALLIQQPVVMAIRARDNHKHFSWTDEAARFIDTLARSYAVVNRAQEHLSVIQMPGRADAVLKDYPLTSNLDPHQRIAVAAMVDDLIYGLCLFDEQGSGKTVMAIHAFDYLKNKGAVDVMIVLAPKNMLNEWQKDFQRFMKDRYRVTVVAGSRTRKYLSLIDPSNVYVTNYETTHLLEGTLRSLAIRFAGRVVLAVDESFFVKNRETKRGAAVRKLRHLCDRCWVLCGTPAPNNALDVVHQFDVADGGVTFSGVTLPDDPAQLRAVVQRAVEKRGLYLRRLKHDILPDLPRKRFEQVAVPMEEEQSNLYVSALKGLVRDVEATTDVDFKTAITSFMARRMALFQLCSNPGQIVPSYTGDPGKLSALDRLLEEIVSRKKEKVVIWSFFRYSLDQIVKRYAKYHPVRVDGSVANAETRSKAVTDFQEDDETMLFVANPAAAGAGITLTRSRIAIYESFSIQAAHYLQSLDRIHRRGQTRDVMYYMLLCENSIEEQEYKRLLQKEEAARQLFSDDDPRPVTREVFLEELVSAIKLL
jgi:SNF2 family DNA or RNA helicase